MDTLKTVRLCVLPGDGIGPAVTTEALKIIFAICEKREIELDISTALIGGDAYDKEGVPLPNRTIEICRSCDAVLLGTLGGSKWSTLPYELRPEYALFGIRTKLGLYANFRSAKIFDPIIPISPIKESILSKGMDVMIVRELTGGIYYGDKGTSESDGVLSAYDTEIYSQQEIERIAVSAFKLALTRRKHVTSVDKANILDSSKLWRETVNKVAESFPEVKLQHLYIDHAASELIHSPNKFDVILTSNLFGDMLSEEAGMIAGSANLLASASLGYSSIGLYEPVHGHFEAIANKNTANPIACILAAAMMFKYSLNMQNEAKIIENAVINSLYEARTEDLKQEGIPTVSTSEMGNIILKKVISYL